MSFSMINLPTPSINTMLRLMMGIIADALLQVACEDVCDAVVVRPLACDDVNADETMNAPIPKSITDAPNVSVFANLRGNILKSTAKIEMHVVIITMPAECELLREKKTT